MTRAIRQMSPLQITSHATRGDRETLPFDATQPIDRTLPFLCPTLLPIYYTPSWQRLSAADQLRFTQLSAYSFNELIGWMEGSFTVTVRALLRDRRTLPAPLCDLLPGFISDEERHQRMWIALNRLAEPRRYAYRVMAITRLSLLARLSIRLLGRFPRQFPVLLWMMLIMEEHANHIARRCAERRPDRIEPHFAAAYLAHVRDEVRHVQIDWHLIESLWPTMGPLKAAINVGLFRLFIRRMIFRADHAAMSVARAMAAESPAVRAMLPQIRRELRDVGSNPEFREMMFSPSSSPIAFRLLERFPKLSAALK